MKSSVKKTSEDTGDSPTKSLRKINFKYLTEKSRLEVNSAMEDSIANTPSKAYSLKGDQRKYLQKPHALATKALYIGEVIENNPDGLGYHLDSQGRFYEGYFVSSKFSGQGSLFLPTGEVITGVWSEGDLSSGTINNFAGKTYEGDLVDLLPEGTGTETSDDFVYKGSFYKGKKHGTGKVEWTDESWYEGQFVMGRIEGRGMRHTENDEYEGMWKANKMHGEGTQTWSNGEKYTGSMAKGLRDGYGVFETATKKYSGFWKSGREDGKGVMIQNGKTTEGIWRNGELFINLEEEDGNSLEANDSPVKLPGNKLTFLDLEIPEQIKLKYEKILTIREEVKELLQSSDEEFDITEGSWIQHGSGVYFGEINSNNIPQGQGMLISSSTIYEGSWEEGRKKGFGRQVNIHQEVYVGNWDDGNKAGFGVLDKKGARYIGDWKDNKFHGSGVLISEEFVYDGEWEDGLQHGFGEIAYSNGRVFTGEFYGGIIRGNGLIMYSNGKGYEAVWNNGEVLQIKRKINKREAEKKLYEDPDDDEKDTEFFAAKDHLFSLMR